MCVPVNKKHSSENNQLEVSQENLLGLSATLSKNEDSGLSVRMSVLVHLFTVLSPVGHVLPPSKVLLTAKSTARWTPL